MKISILGPFAVADGSGAPVAIGRGTERALIALLALYANRPLSTDRIVAGLWGDAPPATARDMVRLYVSRARTRLGGILVSDGGGYALRLHEDDVDVHRFERLRRKAVDAADRADAVNALAAALALWRGEPLEEFADLPFAREQIPHLHELRLAVLEDYHDAMLDLGRGAEAVPALEQLVAEHPYRERLRAQLMLALYRDGRQADALATYRDGRQLLAHELGIEPGPQLRELERAILHHDGALLPSVPAPSTAPRRVRHKPVTAIVVAALAAGGVAIWLSIGGGQSLTSLRANSVGFVDARSGRLVADVRLPGTPVSMAADGGTLWVGIGDRPALVAIDVKTRRVERTIALHAPPRRIAAAEDTVWIDDSYDGTVTRVDERGGRLGATRRLFSPTLIAFAVGPGTLWASSSQTNEAVVIDPRTGRLLRHVHGLRTPIAAASGYGAVWFAAATADEVQELAGSAIHTIPIGAVPNDIATGGHAIWAVTPSDGKLWKIDPRHRDVVNIVSVAADPEAVAAADGSVWVASRSSSLLTRIDAGTGRVISVRSLGRPATAVRAIGTTICVAVT